MKKFTYQEVEKYFSRMHDAKHDGTLHKMTVKDFNEREQYIMLATKFSGNEEYLGRGCECYEPKVGRKILKYLNQEMI